MNLCPVRFNENLAHLRSIASSLRGLATVALTLAFAVLYGAIFLGWVKPVADGRLVNRLEPIILVIMFYYFGRLLSQQLRVR